MSSALAAYEAWVKRNQGWVLPFIDTARSLTLFLPGRFSATEVRAEAVYTVLNLVTLFHDRIVHRAANASAQGFYTCQLKCGPETNTTRRAKTFLSIFHYTEVLAEMIITQSANKRYSNASLAQRAKWTAVLAIEIIKSLCRLLLLLNNKGRMLLNPSPEELERLGRVNRGEEFIKESGEQEYTHPQQALLDMYAKHGRVGNPHGTFRAVTPHPRDRVSYVASRVRIFAEILHSIRPCFYVAALMVYGVKNWTPYVLSLGIDVLSRLLAGSASSMSPAQQGESLRRVMAYSYYLVRDPFFSLYTKRPLNLLIAAVSKFPLVGPVFGNIAALLLSLQQHYFYTSSST